MELDLIEEEIPMVLVINKADLMSLETLEHLQVEYPDAYLVSAAQKKGLETLMQRLEHEHDLWRDRKSRQEKEKAPDPWDYYPSPEDDWIPDT